MESPMDATVEETPDAFISDLCRSIERAGERLARATKDFAIGDLARNAHPERMISFYYITAILDALQDGCALLEVPVPNVTATRGDNHIDALLFDRTRVIFCEFKRAWLPAHWPALANDAIRINRLTPELLGRFRVTGRRTFGFFGSDCWWTSVADAWATGSAYKRWMLPKVFSSMSRHSYKAWDNSDRRVAGCDGYYLTWAVQSMHSSSAA